MNMDEAIREVLDKHGRMSSSPNSLSDGANLYDHGLSSHASVNVMLALEMTFDAEFPDSLLKKSTFESVRAIREALLSMGVSDDVAVGEEK
jgi:acyl carrier protein